MHLVEIPLNTSVYRFRRLPWTEEARIVVPPGEDARKVLLTHALHDISGLPVDSLEDARKVIAKIPSTLRWRVWVLYRGNLPSERYYTSRGLFEAPDHMACDKRLIDEGMDSEETHADAQMVRKFGPEEVRETHALEQRMLAQAVEAHKEAGR